jgi:hypothetical protein
MKFRNRDIISVLLMMTAMLPMTGITAIAAENAPMTPEFAAKQENFRKQKEQQHIPHVKKKAAAEALKAERQKVYKARQAVKNSPQAAPADNKQP